MRARLSAELGRTFELGGETLAAFPLPDALATLKTFPGFEPQRIERLRGIARAALDGKLDADRLGAMPPEAARAELETLPGIGPFYADLILVRATGLSDLLPRDEPRMLSYAGHFYRLRGPATAAQLHKIAEGWTPYRTWGVVLLRVAGDRAGLPFEKREDRVRARMRP
jgi:DNA-3-methyladenine glycosylase II